MTTTIENLNTNKRKFISDDEVYPRILAITSQVESNGNTKKIKCIETSTAEVDETDAMMICEDSNAQQNDTANKSQVSKHRNAISTADTKPTALFFRCYCDPYRLNDFLPYHPDIY